MAKATPPKPPKPPTVGIRSASAAAERLTGRRDPRPSGPDPGHPAGPAFEPPREAAPAAPRQPGALAAWRARISDAFTIRDPLTVAVFGSLLIHGLVLFMRFSPPLPIQVNPNDARLEVVLLNAQTPSRPVTPEVLAQVNQEGGGEHERGRAKSPLPAEFAVRDGTALQERRRRIDQLEAQQRQLMSLAKGPQAYVSPEPAQQAPSRPEATDREEQLAVLSRMQAEIAKNIEDYNKRPKRLTYGVNAVGVGYARYVADWASRIERIGTERYPPEARGRQYDSLIITAEIDKHGNVVDVVINKKSKYEALNRAVKQIVYAGQPYERFPPEMAREGDILQIVRTWTFTNNVLETRSLRGDR
jgi:protein TonB